MKPSQIRNIILLVLAFLLLAGSRTIANFVIEYQWWQELGQTETWFSMLLYQFFPAVVASVVAWLVLMWAHRGGVQFAGAPTSRYPWYSRLAPLALLVPAIVFIGSSVDSWTVMAYVGAQGVAVPADAWADPVFGKQLSFFLFSLPFLYLLLRFVFVTAVFAILVFWLTGRGWQIFERLQRFREGGGSMEQFDPGPNPLLLAGATSTSFARVLGSLGLVAAAAWFFLGRYQLLMNQHPFMTGVDYVDENVTLPLRWLVIAAFLVAVPLLWSRSVKLAAGVVVAAMIANALVPTIVASIFVRPSELDYQRPYIERHIAATSEAYGIARGAQQLEFPTSPIEHLGTETDQNLVDNIRLWDWRAFKDTITQIQALRPYYRFNDIDIDRYTIDGKMKQVLLSAREVDVNQLPGETRSSWPIRNLSYTHGYGVVMSEVNRTTEDGLPMLLIQDAPPEIKIPDIQLTRPEIYYGEVTHDPVFVNTGQPEFDYPSGSENVYSTYQGNGGFPISSLLLRLAASISEGEYNILLTQYINEKSRMMLYRNVSERLEHLAGFIHWDTDPYVVITDDGRVAWIVDGYTASDRHPYSASVSVPDFGRTINYVRNSVKAVVDAYDGTTTLYVFDEEDPIIQAYRNLFPELFKPAAEMPASLRAHVRYPEGMFQIQAEIYRTFHMKDPEVFYTKEDVWDIAQSLSGDTGRAAPMSPTYIVAGLPGGERPEFLLMLPFTPRGKDNLIGWMAARCDGEKLGELFFFQLSKQQLVFGPNQIESRINQDENIARDLTLWNQQGSRVLRGDILALPVESNFLYVESIYIQAESARMPQLRKVVLALGNRLVYEDTFEAALDRLSMGSLRTRPGEVSSTGSGVSPPGAAATGATSQGQPALSEAQMRELATRLRQLRQQAEQLAKELQQVEGELQE
ncbi:MAG: UPF0182 family protein [Bryobacterales bacterium]